MYLEILPNRPSVLAAISLMTPVAREACQLLAHRVMLDRSLLSDAVRLNTEHAQACAVSFARLQGNPAEQREAFDEFLRHHGHAVMNVAVSIVLLADKQAKTRRWMGWLGKAAAVAAGAAIGAFFG
jgi:hypothetical protein